MSEHTIAQKRLKELLNYDPETGIFTWLVRPAKCIQIGDIAGYLCPRGYLIIVINYKLYYSHRLAFLYMTGEFPVDQVDHKNHTRDDNRWKNLRDATSATNSRNRKMPSNNTSGCMGVRWNKDRGKWVAYIMANGKRIHLGLFTEKPDAIAARKKAEIKYGFHKNHGK